MIFGRRRHFREIADELARSGLMPDRLLLLRTDAERLDGKIEDLVEALNARTRTGAWRAHRTAEGDYDLRREAPPTIAVELELPTNVVFLRRK
ncbi:MAG TPA: hypothetical protein VEA80_06780 [Vitreimonas sp.]|uniref:hypothetical protein n=1 Tax=Vitreimonas sp. TaxID=3069702 RepID=UPI002D4C6D10|nr:hypothetical protein [Vitreimonas sp.]HYD87159.1 hypothetical protein [Vitreimonas sp.]